jgi:hypothetical protein
VPVSLLLLCPKSIVILNGRQSASTSSSSCSLDILTVSPLLGAVFPLADFSFAYQTSAHSLALLCIRN